MKLTILVILSSIVCVAFALIPEVLLYYAWTATIPEFKSLMLLGIIMLGPAPCILFAYLAVVCWLFLTKLSELMCDRK